MNLKKTGIREIIKNAWKNEIIVPGFNIPYLPMMEPVVRALVDSGTFGLVMVARLEWIKFKAGGIKQIYDEYKKNEQRQFMRLHLDHIPVIDEDNLYTNFEEIIAEAIEIGYDSVMTDGSRLPLEENIRQTCKITELARQAKIPVESELGAVMGHESGPLPPYEELFASGKGFTSPDEARRFVNETGTDWLSVAVGNIHGAISASVRSMEKIRARLNIAHLARINETVSIPLVLHGGTGISKKYILEASRNGIVKINIATAIRQPYEKLMDSSVRLAQDAVYSEMLNIIGNELEITGSVKKLIDL
jgi:ketose-bisphosphate aldolase